MDPFGARNPFAPTSAVGFSDYSSPSYASYDFQHLFNGTQVPPPQMVDANKIFGGQDPGQAPPAGPFADPMNRTLTLPNGIATGIPAYIAYGSIKAGVATTCLAETSAPACLSASPIALPGAVAIGSGIVTKNLVDSYAENGRPKAAVAAGGVGGAMCGTATALTVAGGLAYFGGVNFWNPVGWGCLIAAAVVGAGAGISYAVSRNKDVATQVRQNDETAQEAVARINSGALGQAWELQCINQQSAREGGPGQLMAAMTPVHVVTPPQGQSQTLAGSQARAERYAHAIPSYITLNSGDTPGQLFDQQR